MLTEGIGSQEKKRHFVKEIDRALVDDATRRSLEEKIRIARLSMIGAIEWIPELGPDIRRTY